MRTSAELRERVEEMRKMAHRELDATAARTYREMATVYETIAAQRELDENWSLAVIR